MAAKDRKKLKSLHTPKHKPEAPQHTPPVQLPLQTNAQPWFAWLAAVLIAVASVLSFSSMFNNELTNWDDNFYITENPMLRELSGRNLGEMFASKDPEKRYYMGNYHPFTMLSLALDFQLGGTTREGNVKPWPYAAHNVALHTGNALLALLLVYLLVGRWDAAAVAGLLFAVSPLHAESVAWLSERKDVLYTFYFFATLILYLLYLRSGQWLWLAAALVTFLLSLLAKGQAVSLAPSLVLIDWVRGRKMLSGKVLAEKIPFFALALVFGLVAIQAQAHGQAIHRIDEYPYSVRIVFAAYGFSQYLFKLIVPHSMAAIYPYPIFDDFPPMFYVAHLLPALAVLGVTLWLLWPNGEQTQAERDPQTIAPRAWYGFGLGFFAINIALLLQLIPVGSAIMADRYAYIPSLGIFIVAGAAISELLEKNRIPRNAVIAVVLAYALFMAMLTRKQADTWKDSMALWEQTLKVSPQAIVAWNNLGSLKMAKAKQNDEVRDPVMVQDAIEDFTKALSIKPDYSTALYNRGVGYYDLQNDTAAINDFNLAVKYDPLMADAYHNRGLSKDRQGRSNEAIVDYSRAIELNSTNEKFYTNRGVAFGKISNFAAAIADFNAALHIDPQSHSAYSNRGLAYSFLQKPDSALADYNQALQLKPDFETALANRVLIYIQRENWQLALADCNALIAMKSQTPTYFFQRAQCNIHLGKTQLVCPDLQKAQALGMPGLEADIRRFCR